MTLRKNLVRRIVANLRVPQVRILKALSKCPQGLTREEIAVKARVSPSMRANLGPDHAEDIVKTDRQYGKRCLYGLGYVVPVMEDRQGIDTIVWRITPRGLRDLRILEGG